MKYNTAVILEDGKYFFGYSENKIINNIGEICFTTSMTGYQEAITDPSYAEQLLVFTFPHIGNVGTNLQDLESCNPLITGIITREQITEPSNYRSQKSLKEFLKYHKINAIYGVDTRALTTHIRKNGCCKATIAEITPQTNIKSIVKLLKTKQNPANKNLTKQVCNNYNYLWHQDLLEPAPYKKNKYKIIAIDYGIKYNILRHLYNRSSKVIVVQPTATAEEILSFKPDGILLSNGPGNPRLESDFLTNTIKKLLHLPIMAICLGHQLLALTLGAEIIKMNNGHRGTNHPIKDLQKNKIIITTQNHGFTVSKTTAEEIKITHISLFDKSIAGFQSIKHKIIAIQFHPEASPGPHDASYLFDDFIKLIDSNHP